MNTRFTDTPNSFFILFFISCVHVESVCITSSLLTTAGEEWRRKPSICNAQSTAQINVEDGGGGGGRERERERKGKGGSRLGDRKSAARKEKERRVRLVDTKREEERK